MSNKTAQDIDKSIQRISGTTGFGCIVGFVTIALSTSIIMTGILIVATGTVGALGCSIIKDLQNEKDKLN